MKLKLKKRLGYSWLPLITLLFMGTVALIRVPRGTLFWLQPLFIAINISLIALFFVIVRKPIARSFSGVPRWGWIALLLIFLLGLSIRLGVPEKLHKIYYDEDIYINMAHNIANEGKACLCDYGTPKECYVCIDNKQPVGMQTLEAIFLKLSGLADSEQPLFVFNIIINSLAICFAFGLAYLLTKNATIGLLSALFLAIIPVHIRWSVTTSQDAFFLTFLLLSLLLFLIKGKHVKLLGFLVGAYTAQLRTEGLLIIIPIAVLMCLFNRRPLRLLKHKEVIVGATLLLLLVAPTVMHIIVNKGDTWGAPQGRKFSIGYFLPNSRENFMYFLQPSRFPVLFSLFLLPGIWFGFRKHTKATLFLLSWFSLFFILYAFFYAGNFNYGMDVRFVLTMIVPFLIIAGFGAYWLWQLLLKLEFKLLKKPKACRIAKGASGAILLLAIVMGVVLGHYEQISGFGQKAGDAMTVHEFAKHFVAGTPNECVFISQVSSMFLNFGRPSIQAHLFLWGGKAQEVLNKYPCVYLYWGYWCASSEPHRREQCVPLLNRYNWEQVALKKWHDKSFVFYKLIP